MLKLAGIALSRRRPEETISTDGDRIQAIRDGRSQLVRLTKRDFGYDLPRWHRFLRGGEFGYEHPYGWQRVKVAIEEAILDPDRKRLVEILVQRDERRAARAEKDKNE